MRIAVSRYDFPQSLSFRLNRVHRLLLYGGLTLWFFSYVLSQKRNYEDSWILADIFWPFVGLTAVFLLVLASEHDNRIVALLCAWTSGAMTVIPALKYTQPYGTSIDASDHYVMVENLMTAGRVVADHTYASIPAMHAWLASLGLAGGLSAAQAIKFGLPLTGMLMPLVVYWACRRADVRPDIAKYTIAATCLCIYPYFEPNGTGFTLVPLMVLLVSVAVRQHAVTSRDGKAAYTLLVLIGLCQLVVWHSTTPLLLPLLLASASFAPPLLQLMGAWQRRPDPHLGLLVFAFLAGLLYLGYHFLESDRVFQVLLAKANDLFSQERLTPSVVPQRIFEIAPTDALRITMVIYGREFFVTGLLGLGVLVVWFFRKQWSGTLQIYAFFGLICGSVAMMVVVALASNTPYERVLALMIGISPFLVGPGLWYLVKRLPPRVIPYPWLARSVSCVVVVAAVGFWLVGLPYQPLVPKVEALNPLSPGEFVVWLHGVNTAYQQRMLTFVETHAEPSDRFAIDIFGRYQFIRYFGPAAAQRRGLYVPLHENVAVDPRKVSLFLLHWPGPAGGLGEKVEYRSSSRLHELSNTPGWGTVYDNGESFILLVRQPYTQTEVSKSEH